MPLSAGRGNARVFVVVVLVGLLAGAAALAYALTRPPRNQHATPATSPSTQPQTGPATDAVARTQPKPKPPATQYLDVVRDHHPKMSQTQPFAVPVDLTQAARLVFEEPVYMSPRQDLWITRPDAPPTESVLARAAKEQHDQLTLTVRDHVVFAHWMPREVGPWTFTLVALRPDGKYEVVTQSGRKPIPFDRRYRWDRALDWNEQVIVPTDTGVSVMRLEPEVTEQHHDFADGKPAPENFAEPQFLLDWEGLLAWAPRERDKTGSRGAARFVEGKWTPLGPEQGWPERLLHLMPLFDGSVLQLVSREEQPDWVRVALTSLDKVDVDEAQVTKLVEEMADDDEKVRQNAFNQLTQFGPGLWPVLEKLLPDAEPEAQARIRQLLKGKVEPQLGGMTILGDQLRLAGRLSDGGAVFFAELGVALPADTDVPVLRTPAWLAVRPGQAVTLMDPPLTDDMHPDRSRVYAFGADWIVINDARGPQRFVGNGFVPLLRKAELAQGFMEPVGIDRRGRWLFRKAREGDQGATALTTTGPATATAPATTVATTTTVSTTTTVPATRVVAPGKGATLVVDPTLPDPTPRLRVWVYQTAEVVGWDASDWPAVRRGGSWALQDSGWRPLKRTDKMYTKPEEVPPVVVTQPATSAATTTPTTATAPATALATGPATTAATSPATTTTSPAEEPGPLLLVDADGNRYYDGRNALVVVNKDGRRTTWTLPPTATGGGSGQVFLVRTNDGLLFLFNQPGRVLRIRPTPDGAEPFELEATFTRNVPSADPITRVWLDPAGRIIMAYGTKLAIMFPQGYIPPAIAKLLPPGSLDNEEP